MRTSTVLCILDECPRLPGDFNPKCCYPPPTWKKRITIIQAVMQILQRQWDGTFSDHSYGFRLGRSAHQAVAKAQQYIAAGHRWVVDFELENFGS